MYNLFLQKINKFKVSIVYPPYEISTIPIDQIGSGDLGKKIKEDSSFRLGA